MSKELDRKLKKIQKVIDINDLINNNTDLEGVKKYYKNSAKAYTFFYSKKGYIHLGISENGKFKKEDLKEAAKIINEYIIKNGSKEVLELATGRGANTLLLAANNPKTNFVGLDLSPGQLKYTKNIKQKNVDFRLGDFHDLSTIPKGAIDLVFVIESLCHSKNPKKVLDEVYRVLKKDGLFIIVDAYVAKDRDEYSNNEKLAMQLAERGMAVDNFKQEGQLLTQANEIGYKVLDNTDKSQQVLPSLHRTEFLAKAFFKFAPLGRFLKMIAGKDVSYNAVSGYLLRYLVENNIASYYVTVLKKS